MSKRGITAVAVAMVLLPLLGACGSSSSAGPGTSASPSVTSTDPTVAVIGMTEAEADAWAKAHGYTTRVVEVDGVPRAVTMDYSPTRINLTLEKGLVVKATIG